MPADVLAQFVQNQSKELDLRARELEYQKQADSHNFEFSKKALDAQLQDRKDERLYKAKTKTSAYVLAGFVTLIIAVVLLYALMQNQKDFALEIIKTISFVFTGGVGGYGLCASKQKKQDEDPPQTKE